MQKEFLGKNGLVRFLAKLFETFSEVGHTHSKADIKDFPTIPTKTSQLTNDSGFKTTDNNTTYTLTKSGSVITLTGTDGSSTSVDDSDTKITVDSSMSSTSTNPVQNKVVNSAIAEAKAYADSAASKIKSDLLNGAGAAYDTLKELGDLIVDNTDAIDALEIIASGKANSEHGHAIADVSGLQTALDGKAASSHGAHVPTPETANSAKFLRNDNTWQTVTPANIGAAASSHGTHVTYSTTNPVMDGTASVGTASTVARSDHKHPTDTSRASKSEFDTHTGNTTVHITSTERTNWNAAKSHADSAHAPSNAEKNQNAFSNIKVGSTTIAADTTTDTLTLEGSNVTITPDATNDKVTIGITKENVTAALGYTPPTTATKYTHPATAGNTHIPAGGSSGQILRWSADGTAVWGNDNNTTYSEATTSTAGLMSSGDKIKLNGIATGANKTIVDSALSTSSTNPVQNKVVNDAIDNLAAQIENAGSIDIDLDGDGSNIGDAPPINANTLNGRYENELHVDNSDRLGGVPANEYAKLVDLDNINSSGMSMELLWENASPTSTFASQHIYLDMTQYKRVKIVFDYGIFELEVGKRTLLTIPIHIFYHRYIDVFEHQNYIWFSDCGYFPTYGSWEESYDNAQLIPFAIYGIKEVSV